MKTSSPTLRFAFQMCNDVPAMRDFYGRILGCQTAGGTNEDGYVSVSLGVELLFFKGDFELPVHDEFAWQPGYRGGTANIGSWSIAMDEKAFRAAAKRLGECSVPKLSARPEWRKDSYWAQTVRDPMGHTLEIYWVPERKPDELEWEGEAR
jgi:catechol 2,3-dioxygenase-like lactoylglutathione lyase family enzyme